MIMETKTDHLQGMDKIMERVLKHIQFFINTEFGHLHVIQLVFFKFWIVSSGILYHSP